MMAAAARSTSRASLAGKTINRLDYPPATPVVWLVTIMVRLKPRNWAAGTAFVALLATSPVVQAQEVVQALPAAGSEDLSDALQRLARNAGDVDALIDAGDAALKLRDIPAAIGFFGRARDISPGNARVSLGMARAYTFARRPVEALRLYAEAERGGIAQSVMAADRGLAFDLVGDAASAQQLYRVAIANGAGQDVTQYLALSQAISGDKAGFEATLLPLLRKGDSAGFRTRAFGLAILGETEEAVKIAEQMMPAQTAARVAPYLRYMTQLTPAQQAAAGSLGVFPRTAAIGRDDDDILAYADAGKRDRGTARAELPPVGAPVAPPPPARVSATPPAVPQAAKQNTASQQSAPVVQPQPPRVQAPIQATTQPRVEPQRSPPGISRNASVTEASDPLARTIARPVPIRAPSPATQDVSPPTADGASAAVLPQDPAKVPLPAPVPVLAQPVTNSGSQPVVAAAPPPANRPTAPAVSPDPAPVQQSVADAFAGFDLATSSSVPRAGAVDITSIKAPREVEKPAPPPPPAHPARHWVQVATGKDLSALGFDWRRISRKSDGALDGKGPFTTRWGEANRLLAGPYPTRDAARDAVAKLKAGGLDAFTFSSAEGEEIAPLK